MILHFVHNSLRRQRRLVFVGASGWSAAAASSQPVRMNHCWAGGIVPPLNLYAAGSCKSSLAIPPPPICLRLLFPAKQTARFPMRVFRRADHTPSPLTTSTRHAVLSRTCFTGRRHQMKAVQTPFFCWGVRGARCGGQEGRSDSAQLPAQRRRACHKSACRSGLTLFWTNALIHFKQLHSNLILIHLVIHASGRRGRQEASGATDTPQVSEHSSGVVVFFSLDESWLRHFDAELLDYYPSADHRSGIFLLMEQAVLPVCVYVCARACSMVIICGMHTA